jgi:hypothetical protein
MNNFIDPLEFIKLCQGPSQGPLMSCGPIGSHVLELKYSGWVTEATGWAPDGPGVESRISLLGLSRKVLESGTFLEEETTQWN